MLFSSNHALKLIGLGWIGFAVAYPSSLLNINATQYAPSDIITRDVCVIGGGATGTYSAIRLREMNQTVVVVEKNNRLGGHTETYTDPATGGKVDIGVVVWHDLPIVRDFFAHFDVPLTKASFNNSGVTQEYVDFRTGKLVNYTAPANFSDALGAYGAQLAQYSSLEAGFYLPDPVPEDLLLPFGDFVEKYSLGGVVMLIFNYGQGLGNLLAQPTLYVFKNFGLDILRNLQVGFLTTARHDNSEIYEKARAELGDDALLGTHVVSMNRQGSDYVRVVVETPSGQKLIKAKKLIITIPPKLDNLAGFDLDTTESSLFGQFNNSGYYTGILRDSGIPDSVSLDNVAPDTPYNLPPLPGLYGIYPTGIAGLQSFKYGSPSALSDEEVQADVITSVQRLRTAGTFETTTPTFAVYASHTPFELTVSTEAIRAGFYRDLYALQGHLRTYWTGAAFHTHDSSLLWQFTESLLSQIVS